MDFFTMARFSWRSIWRNRRRTIITISSIGLGLTFIIFYSSMAEGVFKQLINDGVRMFSGHITLEHSEYRNAPSIDLYISDTDALRTQIEKAHEVKNTKLSVIGQGVARTGIDSAGVTIIGVESSMEAKTSPVSDRIIAGRYLEEDDGSFVVIGSKLAKLLNLRVGKKLVLTTNDLRGALLEELVRVVGIFEIGVEEVDCCLLHVPLDFTRKLYGLPDDAASQIGIILKNPEAQDKTITRIQPLLFGKSISVYPWQEIMPELASLIKLDRGSILVFEGLLMFLILFTIYNTIQISAFERQKEFAVLLALGTPRSLLKQQLLLESAFLGLVGCFLGLTLGVVSAYAVQVWGLDISILYGKHTNVSGLNISPVVYARVIPQLVLTLGGIILGMTIFLSLIPMRRAINIHIVQTLR